MDIHTKYASDNYTVHIVNDRFMSILKDYSSDYSSVFYLVDDNVYTLYKETLDRLEGLMIQMPAGESAKNFNVYENTLEQLIELRIQRNSLIVVIGGGAVGDVGAFIASTVMRGVDYIHVATTILAHDSSVGGKTAINSKHGKNLIGSFYRPKAVIIDTKFFQTLPEIEIQSGFGEIFKHALLNGEKTVEDLMDKHRTIDINNIDVDIKNGVETKLQIVTEDEKERSLRKFLNLGHTLGHAIEFESDLKHGQAVMIGILFMMYVSNEHFKSEIFDINKYQEYMTRNGYPVSHTLSIDTDRLISRMLMDKKNDTVDEISLVLMKSIGTCSIESLKVVVIENYINTFKQII